MLECRAVLMLSDCRPVQFPKNRGAILKFCVVVTVVTGIFVSCKSAEEKERERLTAEAHEQARKLWDIFTICGDSKFRLTIQADGRRVYSEYKRFIPIAIEKRDSSEYLSEAQRLNRNENTRQREEQEGKTEWEGEIVVVEGPWRIYPSTRSIEATFVSENRWSDWIDGKLPSEKGPLNPIALRKVNGQWIYGASPEKENPSDHIQKYFVKPTCSEIPH